MFCSPLGCTCESQSNRSHSSMREAHTDSGRPAEAARGFIWPNGLKSLVQVITLAMVCSVVAIVLASDTLTFFSSKALVASLSSTLSRSARHIYKPDASKTAASFLSCNYSDGKWVKADNRPLYSGSQCKRWLSPMWACRDMPGFPTFEYENYRWQPDGCDFPAFSSQEFLSRMQNKVVAFVGDSIGRQQYQSLMCMLTRGDDGALVEDVSRIFGLVKPRGAVRAEGTAQRFIETNTTILFYWSTSLCELQPLKKTDPHTKYAMHLDRPATFMQKYVKTMDVLVLNTGHHWNEGKITANEWVMHVEGKPILANGSFQQDIEAARNFSVHKILQWLSDEREKNATRAEVFIRSLSPRHFLGGDWNSGGRCDDYSVPVEKRNITGRPVHDRVVEGAVLGTSVQLLNVTYISQFRDDAHISKYWRNYDGQDCLHWCLPGVPDVWNELLYAKIMM